MTVRSDQFRGRYQPKHMNNRQTTTCNVMMRRVQANTFALENKQLLRVSNLWLETSFRKHATRKGHTIFCDVSVHKILLYNIS